MSSLSFSKNAEPRTSRCLYLPCQIDGQHCAALIDSGAAAKTLIGEDLARKLKVPRQKLDRPRECVAFNGEATRVTSFVRVRMTLSSAHEEEVSALVVPRLNKEVILGMPWLDQHNPQVHWGQRTVDFDSEYCLRGCLKPNGGQKCRVEALDTGRQGMKTAEKLAADRTARFKRGIRMVDVEEFERERADPTNEVYRMDISDIIECDALKTQEDISKALQDKPPPDFTKLPSHLQRFRRLFSPTEANALPPRRPGLDHDIQLVKDAKLPNCRLYRMSQPELEVLRKYVDENLKKGYIRPSSSPVASSVLFVRKPAGGLRLCVDYRKLNDVTVKDRTTSPLTDESFGRLAEAWYFTKVDVIAAFNKLRMKEGTEWLTAFRTRFGLFEYTVMPFGLTNAPSSFTRLLNKTLGVETLATSANTHSDDILIFSKTLEEHRRHVSDVFEALLNEGLYLDLEKSEFEVQKVKFLGHILEAGKGIGTDPEKIEAVRSWSTPKSVKEVRSFLGFANYYRRFVEGFSRIAGPLTDLTKSDGKKFVWSGATQEAFETLKTKLLEAPILGIFDPKKPCVVVTDASNFASGGVLKQPCGDYNDNDVGTGRSATDMTASTTMDSAFFKSLRPVAFFSSKHADAESRYDAHDKELLAVVKAFKEWRSELEGSAHQIQVLSDHKNLQYFMNERVLSDRQARWMEYLSRFDFKIRYIPGRENAEADALSRRGQALVHEPTVALPRSLFEPIHIDTVGEEEMSLHEAIAEAYEHAGLEDPVRKIPHLFQQNIRKHKDLPLADCSVIVKEGQDRVEYRGRLWIPDCEDVRRRVIQECHNPPLIGHPGNAGTYARVKTKFFWPRMFPDIKRYVQNCHLCQRSKL